MYLNIGLLSLFIGLNGESLFKGFSIDEISFCMQNFAYGVKSITSYGFTKIILFYTLISDSNVLLLLMKI